MQRRLALEWSVCHACADGERKLAELDFVRLKKFTAAETFLQLAEILDEAEPAVHTITDRVNGSVLVPVMFLRIDAPRAYKELLQMLRERSAELPQLVVQRDRIVIRAEVQLGCRPVGLGPKEVQAMRRFIADRIGHRYGLKNVFDLAA